MFADGVMETSNTTGTSDYFPTGAVFSGRTFASAFADGQEICYIAQTKNRTKFEILRGYFQASPKRLLRTEVLLSSSGGAKVNWLATDVYYIASFSSATVLAGLIKILSAARPWWLQFGFWFKQDFPSAGLHTQYLFDGADDIEIGTLDSTANSFLFKALSATGLMTFLTTPNSANLRSLLTDETGTGAAVFGTSPTIASANLTGIPVAPTPAQGNNDTGIATTAYVDRVAIQQIVQSSDTAHRTTAGTATPADNSIPQNTEGDEYTQIAVNVTPKSATSILLIEVEVPVARANGDTIVLALHRDSVANALAARALFTPSGNTPTLMRVSHRMVAGGTSLITFKARIGSNTANALYLNGISSGGLLGGVEHSFIRVTEYGV